jgi:23S rRNA (uracil-5-)-methyltransferase RumA
MPGDMTWKGVFPADFSGKTVDIFGAFPGCRCEIELSGYGRGRVRARVLKHIDEKPSGMTDPPCPYFGICGGCSLQQAEISLQRQWKKDLFVRLLKELDTELPFNPEEIPIYGGNEYAYRNKMEFSFSSDKAGQKYLGLHEKGRFQRVTNLQKCLLQTEAMNEVFAEIQDWFSKTDISAYNVHDHSGILRHLILRHSNQHNTVLVNLVVTEKHASIDELFEKLSQMSVVSGILLTINTSLSDAVIFEELSLIHGDGEFFETIGDWKFRISPGAFFQVNPDGVHKLYAQMAALLQKHNIGGGNLLDLYCGTGSIGIYLSPFFKQIIGVEEVESAVQDAIFNAELNGVKNISFHTGKVEKILTDGELKDTSAELLVIDPPRSGCYPSVRQKIAEFAPRNILLVSCNAPQSVPDINCFLAHGYQLVDSFMVDMFPQTPHVEAVVLMSRK